MEHPEIQTHFRGDYQKKIPETLARAFFANYRSKLV